MADGGNPKLLATSIAQFLDDDEAFYLQTLRTLIASCPKPYYQRRDFFDAVIKDLHERQSQGPRRDPVVAARLLLIDLQERNEQLARDRARCEAWAIALAVAGGEARPNYKTNPLTGKPYGVVVQRRKVSVGDTKKGGTIDFAIAVAYKPEQSKSVKENTSVPIAPKTESRPAPR